MPQLSTANMFYFPALPVIFVEIKFVRGNAKNAITIERIRIADLPAAWRKQLSASPETRVTILILEKPATTSDELIDSGDGSSEINSDMQ